MTRTAPHPIEAPVWKVAIDPARCQGHNRCRSIAPELFEVDDDGDAWVVGGGLVPVGLEEKARLAVRNCPEQAVVLSRLGEAP